MREALRHHWIDGIAMNGFDSYLTDDARIAEFSKIVHNIGHDFSSTAAVAPTTLEGASSASTDFLLPEIFMLGRLFSDPARIPDPPHIFVPSIGWCIA